MNDRISTFLKILLIVTCLIGPRVGDSQDGYNVDGADLCNSLYDVNGYYYEHVQTFNAAPFYVGPQNSSPNYDYYMQWMTSNGGFWMIRIDDNEPGPPYSMVGFENYTGTSASPPLTGWIPATICNGATPPVLTFVAPVDLVSFDVENKKWLNLLKWETAWEENNEGFEIQHSVDGDRWQVVDFEPGMGSYSGKTIYSYEHKGLNVGNNFYRLKQLDYDGRYEYSDTKQVYVSRGDNEISVYPNPTSTGVVWINGLKENVGFTINDTSGRRLQSGIYSSLGLEVDGLSAGLYFIVINGEDTLLKLIITE